MFTVSKNVGIADSMKPNKLRRHLKTLHPNHQHLIFVRLASLLLLH